MMLSPVQHEVVNKINQDGQFILCPESYSNYELREIQDLQVRGLIVALDAPHIFTLGVENAS